MKQPLKTWHKMILYFGIKRSKLVMNYQSIIKANYGHNDFFYNLQTK